MLSPEAALNSSMHVSAGVNDVDSLTNIELGQGECLAFQQALEKYSFLEGSLTSDIVVVVAAVVMDDAAAATAAAVVPDAVPYILCRLQ